MKTWAQMTNVERENRAAADAHQTRRAARGADQATTRGRCRAVIRQITERRTP